MAKLNYNLVKFTHAAGTSAQLPKPGRPEIAFVGRSNVGKSSIMNKLFNRKSLVKVSSKPGKTTTINFFAVEGVDFVDLPGYGFARVGGHDQDRWNELMGGYFEGGRNIRLVVALVDIRHDMMDLDEEMVDYLLKLELPFCVAFTKADKLSKSRAAQQAQALARQFTLPSNVSVVVTSATSGIGMNELKTTIEQALHG